MVNPSPPYSLGKQIPANPQSHSRRCSALSWTNVSSASARSGGGASGARTRMCSANHALARSRKASTLSISSGSSGTGDLRLGGALGRQQHLRQPRAVLRRRALQVAVEGDAPEVEAQVVLPGHPDAPVELRALLHDLGRVV